MPGMKVFVTDEKELIMEPSIKWAGNPNILVAVKAFGLKATAQVFSATHHIHEMVTSRSHNFGSL